MNFLSKYKYWIAGAFCLGVIGLIIGAIRPKGVSGAPPSSPPEVEVVQVEQKDVPIYGEWIGTLDGLVNADVRAQVTGYLMRQGYQEGAFVKKGDLLFQIDPRPFQAALDQAEGQLAQAKAMLANAQAVQRRTELDVNRYTPLERNKRPANRTSTTPSKTILPPKLLWRRSRRKSRRTRPPLRQPGLIWISRGL